MRGPPPTAASPTSPEGPALTLMDLSADPERQAWQAERLALEARSCVEDSGRGWRSGGGETFG